MATRSSAAPIRVSVGGRGEYRRRHCRGCGQRDRRRRGTALDFENAGTRQQNGRLGPGQQDRRQRRRELRRVHTNGVGNRLDEWTGVTIGGTAAGAGNIIGSFNAGIGVFGSQGNLIQGNFIGTDPTGTLNLGNQSSYGVASRARDNNTIGGTAAGAGNIIANDDVWGLCRLLSTGDAIIGNSIFANSVKAHRTEVQPPAARATTARLPRY